jgi:hypothetical protein
MDVKQYEQQVQGILALQNSRLEKLAKLRTKETNATIDVEKAELDFYTKQEELTKYHRISSIGIAHTQAFRDEVALRQFEMDDEGKMIDDPQWSQLVMDKFLHEDEAFVGKLGEFYDAQENVGKAKAELHRAALAVRNVSDELGSLKNRSLLLAALMNAISA